MLKLLLPVGISIWDIEIESERFFKRFLFVRYFFPKLYFLIEGMAKNTRKI